MVARVSTSLGGLAAARSLRTALLGLSALAPLAIAAPLEAADRPLPLGLLFVPPGLGQDAGAAPKAEGALSVLDSLASSAAAPAEQPAAVASPAAAKQDAAEQASAKQDSGRAQIAVNDAVRRPDPAGGRRLSPRPTQLTQAQDPPRGETVLSRERPDFDPIGLRIGAFQAFPSLTVEEQFNDNVFRTDGNEKADLITTIRPRLAVRSDWSRHSLLFDIDGAIGLFYDNDSEDYEDARVGASGRLDIDSETYLAALGNFQQLHEDRGSPDDVSGREPTEFNVWTGGGELFRRFGPLSATASGRFERLNFVDVDSLVGTTLTEINNDDRDRDVITSSGKLAYELLPETSVFVRGSGNWRDYKDDVDDSGVNRDSDGYGFGGGVEVDLGGLLFGDFFIGYREQDYDAAALEDLSGVSFSGELTWNVTPLTTVVAAARRTIEETTIAGSSGFFANRGTLSVDHELMRNVLVLLDGGFQRNDYEGIDRQDDIVTAGAEARYLVTRNLYLSGAYRFRNRDSDSGADFTENAGLVKVGVQY